MIGRTLQNRYRITQILSREGGSSDTYIAQDLQRPGHPDCVVKHFKPKFDRDGSQVAQSELSTARQYFDREAQQLYNLKHDQIPELLAQFEENNEFFIVMEYVRGHLLSSELTPEQPWNETAVVQLLADLLGVLKVVHEHGLIHRDIKPSNVIRRDDDRLVLIDFGGVKEVATADYSRLISATEPRTLFLGTPGYMPPEQAMRRETYPQSDLYSVGVIALQALTGRSAQELPYDSQQGCLNYQSVVQVSDRLQVVLDKLTAPGWQERYDDATVAWKVVQSMSIPPTVYADPPPNSTKSSQLANPTTSTAVSSTTSAPQIADSDQGNKKKPLKSHKWLKVAAIASSIVVLASGSWLWLMSSKITPSVEQLVNCDRSLPVDSGDHQAWYEQAMCYGQQGNVDQALDDLQRAIELYPPYRDSSQTYVDFYSIRQDPRFQALIREP